MKHMVQISNFTDVVLFLEDMHFLKHPRKELGMRSEKQLLYPTKQLTGSQKKQETFRLERSNVILTQAKTLRFAR